MALADIVLLGNLSLFRAEIESLKQQEESKFKSALAQKNSTGQTLLHIAAKAGHSDIVRELLLLGFSSNERDLLGLTPMALAQAENHAEVVALLNFSKIWHDPDMPFSLGAVIGYIGGAFEKIKLGSDKDLVLVVGNTGAGKSTLINYLLGTRYKIKQTKRDFYVEPRERSVELAQVGRSATISETLYPQIFSYKTRGQEFALCDLAGFFDTRGGDKAICAASSTQMLTRSGAKVKALLLALSYDDLKGTRALAFKQVCHVLQQVLGDKLSSVANSLYFVITKAEHYSPEEIIESYLTELLDHPKEGLIVKKQAGLLSEEELSLYNIVTLMRNNPKRILVPNIEDDGESAKQLVSAIQASTPQPTNFFSFTRHDTSQIKFNEVLFKIARWYVASVHRLEEELPQVIRNIYRIKKEKEEYVRCWLEGIKYHEAEKHRPFKPEELENKVRKLTDNNRKSFFKAMQTDIKELKTISNQCQLYKQLRALEMDEEIAGKQKLIDDACLKQKELAEKITALEQEAKELSIMLQVNDNIFELVCALIKLLGLVDSTKPKNTQDFIETFAKRHIFQSQRTQAPARFFEEINSTNQASMENIPIRERIKRLNMG